MGSARRVCCPEVRRPSDGQEYDLTIIREPIISQTVAHQMLDAETGYIQVGVFRAETTEQFKQAVDDLVQSGTTRVYDSAREFGRSLNSAADMLDYLLPDGLLVYTADKMVRKKSVYEGKDGHEVNLPSVVLVDGNSASASEVFASAMRDYERAKLVGAKTFGKGSCRRTFRWGTASVVRLTTTAYFTKKQVSDPRTRT